MLATIHSCDLSNNGGEEQPKDEYLVSYELHTSYVNELIKATIGEYVNENPELQTLLDNSTHGVNVYKITYHTPFNGELIKASGLVCLPTGVGPFPTLSYQNGTNTLHSNAPSVNPDNEIYLLLEYVASTGFVVVMPDYLGFGESSEMFHPYLNKELTVSTVLDMHRAVKELYDNHLKISWSNDIYLAGYSQGGWSALHLHKEIEEKYVNEFNLIASACGAGPYDLSFMNDYILSQSTYPQPYFLAYVMNSYRNTGLSTPINEVFSEPYAGKIPSLFDGTKTGNQINQELSTNLSELLTNDYYSGSSKEVFEPLFDMMEENSIDGWRNKTPIMLIHGLEDDFIPWELTSNYHQELLAAGTDSEIINLVPLMGMDHQSAVLPSIVASVNFFIETRDK